MYGTIVAAFVAWLTVAAPQFSDVDAPSVRVEVATENDLWHKAYGPVPFPENPLNGRIIGLYIAGTDTIFISSNCAEVQDLFCQSVILHELVHHYQFYSDLEYECVGRKEFEAYGIQEQWMKEQGAELYQPKGRLNMLWTAMLSMCPDEPFAEQSR